MSGHRVVLAIRTDTAEASVALLDSAPGQNSATSEIDSLTWTAGRQLSDQLLSKVKQLLQAHELAWRDFEGIIVFKGPGSFTGLRIGVTVANTLAYSLGIPVVAAGGPDWVEAGWRRLSSAQAGEIVLPEYGAEVNITKSKG
ncbi:tRNA (adenosine(37)-N6)-threonylcarbamoyltransferase complex dimerization subunit type 1 TsaB [Candidatus Parcubacteria bacterium]|nr:tRNA (adenosine(37)-N6)-threonylcarbamoyltransferase complex dimerization subunit type 1 TsaB [Candidatus Parcubacteria bacterium]